MKLPQAACRAMTWSPFISSLRLGPPVPCVLHEPASVFLLLFALACVFFRCPGEDWCAREDLNLQTGHSLACRSGVFHCYSLPVDIQRTPCNASVLLHLWATISKKSCAISVQILNVCKSCAKPKCRPKICAKSVQKNCAPVLALPDSLGHGFWKRNCHFTPNS